jgi:hypothetical protein
MLIKNAEVETAMSLRDGGTTCVTLASGAERTSYTFDYRLPWDGRERYVYAGSVPFERARKLMIGSEEEAGLLSRLLELASKRFGREEVLSMLSDSANAISGDWFYVLGFLRLASRESRLKVPRDSDSSGDV